MTCTCPTLLLLLGSLLSYKDVEPEGLGQKKKCLRVRHSGPLRGGDWETALETNPGKNFTRPHLSKEVGHGDR
jgi:hypothetical protein